jgi:rRNA maturation RNase YbeY
MSHNHFRDPGDYSGLYFFNESSSSLPVDSDIARKVISLIEKHEKCRFQLVEIVFVDETEIKEVNRSYLGREYSTDIITFSYHESFSNQRIEGTLYCCVPRIYEQAENYNQPAEEEFKRIIIHGLLHLIGYDDQSEASRKKMREREDFYLRKMD